MKAAQQRGKDHPDYDPVVYYGDLLWTRVMSRSVIEARVVETFDLGPDVAEDRQEVKHAVSGMALHGKELFNPNTFSRDQSSLKVNDHTLAEHELLQFAKVTTLLRAEVKARADQLRVDCCAGCDDSEEEFKDHRAVANRSIAKKKYQDKGLLSLVGHESNIICTRRKPLRKNLLTAETV